MQYLCIGLLYLLQQLNHVLSNWGLSIISLALCVRILLYPLSKRAMESQRKYVAMQKLLAPEIAQIKKSYKGAEQSEQILALYKKNNISPFASLKPLLILLIQLPIFIALYHVLKSVPELQTASFLWIKSLGEPDRLFDFGFNLPILGRYFNALPFIMTVTTLLTMKISPAPATDRNAAIIQNLFMFAMAATFLILFYNFPSGIVLYWTMANAFMLLQNLMMKPKQEQLQS